MATFQIQGSDGKTYTVNAPEGSNESALKKAVEEKIQFRNYKSQVEILKQEKIDDPDKASGWTPPIPEQQNYDVGLTSWEDDFLGGFGQGVKGVGESAALGFAAQFNEETETKMRDSILDASDKVGKFFSKTPIGYQVQDEDTVLTGIGRALGSVAGFMAPSVVAGGVALAAPATAFVGGLAGLAAATGLAFTGASGEASERARAAGATQAEREKAASLLNPKVLGAGGVELIPLGRFVDLPLLTTLTNKIGPELTKKFFNYAGRSIISGTMEGAQEAASQFLQNLNQQEYDKLQTLTGGLGESAGYGTGAGALMQLFQDAITPKSKIARRDYLRDTEKELKKEIEELEAGLPQEEVKAKIREIAQRLETEGVDIETEKFTPPRVKFLQDGVVTKELLDNLGVNKNAALRKRIENKNYSDPKVAEDFDKYVNNTQVKQKTKDNIKSLLDEQKTKVEPEEVKAEQKIEPEVKAELKIEPEVKAELKIEPEVKAEEGPVAPLDTSVEPQLIKVEDGKIVPDTGPEFIPPKDTPRVEIAGQKIEPKLEIPSKIDPANIPTDTGPRLGTEPRLMSATEMGNFVDEKMRLGKTQKEVMQEVEVIERAKIKWLGERDARENEAAELKRQGLSEEEINKRLPELGPPPDTGKLIGETGTILKTEMPILSQKQIKDAYKEGALFGKSKGEVDAELLAQSGKETEILEQQKVKIKAEDKTRLESSGLGAPVDTSVTPRLEIADDKPGIRDVETRKLKIADTKPPVKTTTKSKISAAIKTKLESQRQVKKAEKTGRKEKLAEEVQIPEGYKKLSTEEAILKLVEDRGIKDTDKSTQVQMKSVRKAYNDLVNQGNDPETALGILYKKNVEAVRKEKAKLKEAAAVEKDLAPIVSEVEAFEPIREATGKRKKTSLDNIETAVVNNIQQEEKKVIAKGAGKGGFKVFDKETSKIQEEIEQIKDVQRYTIEDTVYREKDKIPQGKKINVEGEKPLPKGKKIGNIKIASGYLQNRTAFSEPFSGRTKAGKVVRSEEVILESNDEKQIDTLISKPLPQREIDQPTKSPKASARMYFLKQVEPGDTLEIIAHELVNGTVETYKKQPEASEAVNAYFEKTGVRSAIEAEKWIKQNLSEKAVKSFNNLKKKLNKERLATLEIIDEVKTVDVTNQFESKAKITASTKKQQAAIAKEEQKDIYSFQVESMKEDGILSQEAIDLFAEDVDLKELLITPDAVSKLAFKLSPLQISLLKQGELGLALDNLAATSDKRTAKIINALKSRVPNIGIEIVDNLKDASNRDASGTYDYTVDTNAIKLDSKTGLNSHVLLHELVHAATSLTIANKEHPVTKKLETLFNNVKDSLDTAYGAKNLQDFVSETLSNTEFQQKLAGINPKGEPINAQQGFFNIIGNFLRRLIKQQPKEVKSALNESDALINALLYPRHDSTMGAGQLLGSSLNPEAVWANLQDKEKQFSITKKEYQKNLDTLINYIDSGKDAFLGLASGIWGSQNFADIAERYNFKTGHKLHKLIQTKEGEEKILDKIAEGTVIRVGKYIKSLSDKEKRQFDYVVNKSSFVQVDPTKDKSVYEESTPDNNEVDSEGKTKLDHWKDLNKKYNSLKPEGQQAYTEMRDTYIKYFNQLRAVLEGRIDELVTDKEQARSLKKEMFKRLFSKAMKDPYFPFARKGKYWIKYNLKGRDSTDPVFEAFESKRARDKAAVELENELKDQVVEGSVEVFKKTKIGGFDKIPATAFITSTVNILEKNKVDQDVQNQLIALFIDSLPESSIIKNFKQRENRLGFIEDSYSVFANKTFELGRTITKFKYQPEFAKLQNELKEEHNKNRSWKTDIIANEIGKRIQFGNNPPINDWAAHANRIAFLGTIGFNASSSVVNSSQIPLVFMPLLAWRYGHVETTKAFGLTAKLLTNSGVDRELPTILGGKEKIYATPSIDNYFILVPKMSPDGKTIVGYDYQLREDMNLDKTVTVKGKEVTRKELLRLDELKTLVEIAEKRNQLSRTAEYDTLSIEQARVDTSLWNKTNLVAAFSFHQVEKYNRQTAITTAYFLELDRLNDFSKNTKTEKSMSKKEKELAAAESALYQATEMNGGNTLATAPRLAQQGVGRVAFMYKGYGASMIYLQLKTIKRALPRILGGAATKEERDIARKQWVGLLGSSYLLAGIQGMPFVGAFCLAYNLLFKEDDEDDAETHIRNYFGEKHWKGYVNYLTGKDVAARMGLSNLLFKNNQYNRDEDVRIRFLMGVGGPFGSIGWQFKRGIVDDIIVNGEIERGIENMMPAAWRNMYKGGVRYPREGILTRRGDVIVARDDLTTGDLIAQALGFAPTKYTLKQEINQNIKRKEKIIADKRSKILKKLYKYYNKGDYDSYMEQTTKATEFNKKYPQYPISVDTMNRSISTNLQRSVDMHNGVTLNPKLAPELRDDANNYWGY